MDTTSKYQVIVAGGGLTGITTALGLAQLGLRVALVESVLPKTNLGQSPSFDQRSVALSASSVAILDALGIWSELQSLACSIRRIHVSERGGFGMARFDASEYQVAAFGQVIPLEDSGPRLWRCVQQSSVDSYAPYQVGRIDQHADGVTVALQPINASNDSLRLTGALLIAADGTFSGIAKSLQLPIQRDAYDQVAVIANIRCEKNHQGQAFERFTAHGPLALLPLNDDWMSLVWCHPTSAAETVMAWSDSHFCDQLQTAFGYRLGRILQVAGRASYPLALHWAQHQYQQRVLLLGNAAHTLHPVAGQGFNLGLRDIAALLEQVASRGSTDVGSDAFLQNYLESRRDDWLRTRLATDSLARLFTHDWLPLALGRSVALSAMNRLPWVKAQFVNHAMGYAGRSSRLARGLAIANWPEYRQQISGTGHP